jgi:hypothetical protein
MTIEENERENRLMAAKIFGVNGESGGGSGVAGGGK